MSGFLRKLFDNNEREVAKYRRKVDEINALEPQMQKLSLHQLREKTEELQNFVQTEWAKKLENMEREGVLDSQRKDKTRKLLDEVLDQILPTAFAVVREAGRRTIGQRHYDVQLIGGMVTHDGRIGELRTGEGKTLMATLPLYLNALAGKGAHLVTANDYLSKVGAVWMGPIYTALGMTVGIIQGQSAETEDMGGSFIFDPSYETADPRDQFCRPVSRHEAYMCDVTYGTNNEYGFDYLRDNMALDADDLSQRELHFAIVDEVDSILIDEARTPLIISGPVQQDTSKYSVVDRVVRTLKLGKDAKNQAEKDDPEHDRNNPNIDYLFDEKAKTVALTDAGVAKVERGLGVSNLSENPEMMHYITAGMKAHALFKKDIDYVVKEGEIIIVDEFTGRLMFGRRYSDGLHQSIEAKEGVKVKNESQTLATITFQNLFRLYLKLAGMTGTAKTEEDEFRKIYGLDVVQVPTNKPMIRKDQSDVIYKLAEFKYRGVSQEVLRLYSNQQPVLVGTRSIEMSELVSRGITAQSLQVLAMVQLLRDKLDNSKTDKAKREQYDAVLNTPMDSLGLAKLVPLAREFGFATDPLDDANQKALGKLIGINETVEAYEYLDEALRHGIPHNVLNAKFHEKEAVIIAEAGRKGAVTIATNMAGRGVDILLGGKPESQELPPGQDTTLVPDNAIVEEASPGGTPEVQASVDDDTLQDGENEAPEITEEELLSWRRGGKPGSVLATVTGLSSEEHKQLAEEVRKLGGLYILGTERHESWRIDNQLRGRAGRQGDPGESRFYVSLEDELWRLFGDRANHPFLRGWPDELPMDQPLLSKMIERAQKKVEEHHFESRKHVLSYDDIKNQQREVIYRERRRILEGENLRDTIFGFMSQVVTDAVNTFLPDATAHSDEGWNLEELYSGMIEYFPLHLYVQPEELEGKSKSEIEDMLQAALESAYADKEREFSEIMGDEEGMRQIERWVALRAVNTKWMEHLANTDYLQENIGLRGYGQQDPLLVFQKEMFEMFETMQHSIQDEIARFVLHVQLAQPEQQQQMPEQRKAYGTFVNLDDDEEIDERASADLGHAIQASGLLATTTAN